MTDSTGFIHLHHPPPEGETRYLLLLHGTGGDEHDMVSLGRIVAPAFGYLAPRGQVLEGAAHRYFRRLAEGVFDVPDLKRRADQLADWIVAAATRYRIDRTRLTALGFSNGANIASAMLFQRPEAFGDAVLLRPMVPFEPDPGDLGGRRILALGGSLDPITPTEHLDRLTTLLAERGATVDARVVPAGHGLVRADLEAVASWLQRTP
ncbi:MAG: alpha/beta hydrolase [Gemmatimonadetes bacterium]|nr:alpha/beta hydrolase [Gemmatimonadota bacterium]